MLSSTSCIQGRACGVAFVGWEQAPQKHSKETGWVRLATASAMVHWMKKKVMNSCEHILMHMPTSLHESEPSEEDRIALTFSLPSLVSG